MHSLTFNKYFISIELTIYFLLNFQTDDKGVFSSSLSQEYAIAASVFNMSKLDMWNLSFDSINYIFEQTVIKEQLKVIWEKWRVQNNF